MADRRTVVGGCDPARLAEQALGRYHLSGLRHVFCGAAPLPLRLARELERRVPSASVLQRYGCSESSSIITATPPAVVGRLDPRLGEEVVAFVAPRPGADRSSDPLVESARERLGPAKSPREVRVVEEIPLTPVGKVDRKRLRAGVAAERPAGQRAP